MVEKDFNEEALRKKLFDIRMKLALLANKDGNPLYEEEINIARGELAEVKREIAKYKREKKFQSEGMRR